MKTSEFKLGGKYRRPHHYAGFYVELQPGRLVDERGELESLVWADWNADDWTEVRADPCESGLQKFLSEFSTGPAMLFNAEQITLARSDAFRAGWSARGDSRKIDVDAAYQSWVSRDPAIGVETLLNEINAGEFRVQP